MNIIVIGSGPSALSSAQGDVIDSFDEVVRINLWVTRGYEEFVGSRITHWAINSQPEVREKLGSQTSALKSIIQVGNTASEDSVGETSETIHQLYPNTPLDLIDREFIMELRDRMGYWPTTGIYTLLHLLRTRPVVYHHGFDIALGHSGKAGHYYPSQWPGIHNRMKEYALIEEHLKSGRLKALMP